jgi:hypothetical protein
MLDKTLHEDRTPLGIMSLASQVETFDVLNGRDCPPK